MICDLHLFFLHTQLLFQLICTLYYIIMLIYPFCEFLQLILQQSSGLFLLTAITDQADKQSYTCRDASRNDCFHASPSLLKDCIQMSTPDLKGRSLAVCARWSLRPLGPGGSGCTLCSGCSGISFWSLGTSCSRISLCPF